MLKILIKFGDKELQTIESDKPEIIIGRNPGSDIQIDNLGVSDRHARIFTSEDQYQIEDLQSTNGTFVDEKQISQVAIDKNSQIIIGKHNLIVLEAGSAPRADAPKTDKTMKLDTRQYKEMLKKQ